MTCPGAASTPQEHCDWQIHKACRELQEQPRGGAASPELGTAAVSRTRGLTSFFSHSFSSTLHTSQVCSPFSSFRDCTSTLSSLLFSFTRSLEPKLTHHLQFSREHLRPLISHRLTTHTRLALSARRQTTQNPHRIPVFECLTEIPRVPAGN
ncbi:hypothetical protein VTJ04DRAFT_9624 [Mycothermus thermophilus]|uniref:uncharacterized protein n=1 Tax=Humicola insolens TaxID=85995 RepID=UPI003743D9E2